jgi:hypothetical protein
MLIASRVDASARVRKQPSILNHPSNMNPETTTVAATPVLVTPKPTTTVSTGVNLSPPVPAKTRAPRAAKKPAAPAPFVPAAKP